MVVGEGRDPHGAVIYSSTFCSWPLYFGVIPCFCSCTGALAAPSLHSWNVSYESVLWCSSGRGGGEEGVCHLSAPCEPKHSVWLRVVAVALDIFTPPPSLHPPPPPPAFTAKAHIGFTAFPTEGKQMRRNVNSRLLMQRCARICAPAARTEPFNPPSCQTSRTEAASFQHRRQRHKPTRPHPLLVHLAAALLSSPPHPPERREKSAYAFSVLVQGDLLFAREACESFWDVIRRGRAPSSS